MDQEGNNGRRRSSRLAARGIVTTPKAEIIVKKTNVKSSEKPKRSKRKTTEEIIELPDAKKTKTEDKISSDEVEKNEIDNADVKNDISGISPMDVDNVEETNVSPLSNKEIKDLPKVEENTAVPLDDEKVVETLPGTNDEKKEVKVEDEKEKVDVSVEADEKKEEVIASVETEAVKEEVNAPVETEAVKEEVNTSVETEDKKPEIKEDLIKTKSPEKIEQPINDKSQDEPKQEILALENSNGKIDEKETIKSVEEIVNNDIGFCVATEDIVTPNGDTDEQVKSTNGDESTIGTETVEPTEPIKVLCVDTNHVETDLKAITTTTAISTNNDAPIVEQVEKELDKSADIVVDNKSVSADDIAPKVDPLSTVVS